AGAAGGLLTGRELVRGHVVTVRPDADLRVVVEHVRAEQERVQVVRAGRVAGRRDRDALAVLLARGRLRDELRDEPPFRELVVDDDRVAVVVGRALAVGTGPELVDRRRAAQDRA